MTPTNELGKSYGRLTVLEQDTSLKGKARWICICKCGNKTSITGDSLRRRGRGTKSCGCLHRESISLPYGLSAKNLSFSRYKSGAKIRKLEFTLSFDEVIHICSNACFYCGIAPKQIIRSRNGDFIYNGIDRIDNSKGYTKQNCMPCCGECNWLKADDDQNEFRNKIKMIYNHFVAKRDYN